MAYSPVRRPSHVARPWLNPRERGTALIEFVLCTGLIIVPVFFGVIVTGLSLITANQVTEVCRDTGHMYAYGVDLSQATSKSLVATQLAAGLSMSPSGSGNGVIHLSTLTYVDATSCTAAGLKPNHGQCPNMDQIVVVKRLVIGNPSVRASTYAPNITPGIVTSSGNIGSADYLTDGTVLAPAFANSISLTVGQYAYLSEMFVKPPSGALWSLFGSNLVTATAVF